MNPNILTTVSEAWGSQSSSDRPGVRTPEEVFFDLQEPTPLDSLNEGIQYSHNNAFRMPQSLHGDNIDPSLMDWQPLQLASQVPYSAQNHQPDYQNHGAQYNFGGSYPPALRPTNSSYLPGANYLPSPIYSQQTTICGQNNGRYHNTSDPYFQHQTQTFQQPLPIKPASSAGSGPSVMLPPLMTPAQQLQSFVQPQQHSQTHNGLPEQWRAIATPRRALSQVPPRRSQSRASQPTPEQSVTRTPVPRAGDYAYVPVSPRFGDLYRPKQCDNMGNPTTWEHTITKEEYTCDELWVIHDGIEVWAYLHTHPDIRRLGMNH